MPTEVKYVLLWVVAAFAFIALIIYLWLMNAGHMQNVPAYGKPVDTAALQSPHTPLVTVEDRQATQVSSIAEALPDATRFAALLQNTGVDKLLAKGQPYTIFVPTDRAMRELPPDMLSTMTQAELMHFVEYHVVVGRSIDVNAVDSGTVPSLAKDLLNFSINPGDQSARVNSSVVLEAFKGKNGIVYLINSVLIPPLTFAQ